MNPFLQIPVLANIESIGVNTPKDINAGTPESSGGDLFATVLDGTLGSKGQLLENMKSFKGERNALADALINNQPGLGVDPELFAALNIKVEDGVIMTTEVSVDAESANVEAEAEQLPMAIPGQMALVNQLNIAADDAAVDSDVSAQDAAMAANDDESVENEGTVELKSNSINANLNETALDNIMVTNKNNRIVVPNKTVASDDSLKDDGIIKTAVNDNTSKNSRTISLMTNNTDMLSGDKLSVIDNAAADDIIKQVENKLNISRIEISKEAPIVKTESAGQNEAASIAPKNTVNKLNDNTAEEIADEDSEQSEAKAAHSKTDAANKTLSASVSDKAGNLTAKAEISNNNVELQTIKGIDTESIPKDNIKIKSSVSAETSTSVKFVLPEDLSGKNIQSKHTIFIKLEPESLGTVRLTLSSQGDSIMGRMVVDSTTARNAVESHINNLLENLAEKGVQLDAFQVSVGGGQTGRRYMQDYGGGSVNRQYGWSREMKNYENELQGITGASRGNQYIGRLGVNWLA